MSLMMASKVATSVQYPNVVKVRATSAATYPNSHKATYPNSVKMKTPGRMQTRIHRLIEEQGVVLVPGCYDGLSASIVQKTGFSAAFVSGYSLSASLLGKPDLGLLTTPEIAACARSICAAAPQIPILTDADTGGGNALNVQRTVRDMIAAGTAGCFLEDQACPRKCGNMIGKKVIPADEHAAKIAAARDAIGDSDFFLVARTDACASSEKNGLSEAISRANLYLEAGADAIFVAAPRSDEELKAIGKEVKGFLVATMLEGGVTPLHTPEELGEMGFNLIVYPLTSIYASARAMIDIYKTLKENGTTRDHLHKVATFDEFNHLVDVKSFFAIEERYAKYQNGMVTDVKQPHYINGTASEDHSNIMKYNAACVEADRV